MNADVARQLALVWLALLAASCDGGIVGPEFQLRVDIATRQVTSGQAFAVRVVRVWRDDHSVDAVSPRLLAPLQLRLLSARERRADGRVEETSEFAGYAFARGDLSIKAPSFMATPKLGGAVRQVSGEPIALSVAAALPDDALGSALELPGEPLPLHVNRWPYLGYAAVALAAVAALTRWFAARSKRAPRVVAATTADPAIAALAELRALRTGRILGVPLAQRLAAVVREFVRARFAVPAGERTTSETDAALLAQAAPEHGRARQALEFCDGVKFAQVQATPAQCDAALRDAEQFVARNAAVEVQP